MITLNYLSWLSKSLTRRIGSFFEVRKGSKKKGAEKTTYALEENMRRAKDGT
jgi:hypothetical protein